MVQYVRLARDPEFSGTLTFSRAPGGELAFEDGAAEVGDDVDVAWLVDRYPNLVAGDAPAADDADDVDAADADADAADTDDSDVDAPVDPADYTVSELEGELADGDYSDAELDALAAAERDGKDRDTALEAIDSARIER